MTESSVWLPKGEQGDPGPQGPEGPPGPQGPIGGPGPDAAAFVQFTNDLANITDPNKNVHLIGYKYPHVDSVGRLLDNKLLDLPVSVLDFGCPTDGIGDAVPALVKALGASNNVFFPNLAAGYAFKSNANITCTKDTRIDFNNQLITSTNSRVTFQTSTVISGQLAQTAQARYSKQWVIQSATGVQPGDLLYVNTSVPPLTGWADTKKDLVKIRSVVGETLTLDEGINFAYSTGDAGLTCTVYRPVRLELLDANLLLNAPDGEAIARVMIDVNNFHNVYIRKPKLRGLPTFDRATNIYRVGIQIYRCWAGVIEDGDYDALSYPIGIYGGSRHFLEINTKSRYCHHSHADCGDWASDYLCENLRDSDSYQAVNSHPAFRVNLDGVSAKNNFGVSNMRQIGGSLNNFLIESSADDTQELPQFQSEPVNAGYEYLYADADMSITKGNFVYPNRVTKPPVEIRYGRSAYYAEVTAPRIGVSAATANNIARVIFGPGCRIGSSQAPSPSAKDVRSSARVHVPPRSTANLTGGVYNIDLREAIVDQSTGSLKCYGQIFRAVSSDPAGATIRIHTNCFTGFDQADMVIGKLKLLGIVRHQNTGLFSTKEQHYNFAFQAAATSIIEFPTTPVYTSSLSGQANESLTMALGTVSFQGASQIGVAADHYVQFAVTLSSGRTSPLYSLSYELELVVN